MKTIRALPEDASTLTDIAHAAKGHWGYPKSWLREWDDVLSITSEYILNNPTYVAISDERIVGFCSVLVGGDEARLDHLWVMPSEMKRGVGRALFELAEGIAHSSGAGCILVESDPHAEAFYVVMGATSYGQVPAAMDENERFLPLLRKSL
jgi:GNAT superfamily N-acetyltransferase